MPVVCHAIAISFWSCSLQHLCRGWGVVRRERLSRQVVTVSSGLRSFLLMGTNWARFYHQNLIALFLFFELTKTESFYNVNYGSSVITSKRSSKNISLIKTNTCDDITKIVHSGILIHGLSWTLILKTTKTQVFVLITEIFWQTF